MTGSSEWSGEGHILLVNLRKIVKFEQTGGCDRYASPSVGVWPSAFGAGACVVRRSGALAWFGHLQVACWR